MILLLVELFTNIKRFGFVIKPSSGRSSMLYNFWIFFKYDLTFADNSTINSMDDFIL